MKNEKAAVIIAIFIVLVLFLSPNVPTEEPSQQKNNPFIEYQTEHYQIITEVSSEVTEKVGNDMEALTEFNKAIERDDSYHRYYYFRARTYYRLERYDQAIKNFKRALDISPEYTAALFLLAKAYQKKKDYVRAKESLLMII